MSSSATRPPEADEYAPFYAPYVALVRGRDPLGVLKRQIPALRAVCAGLPDAQARARYAPGKWSLKEVVGHLADVERVFAYRMLRIVRGDATPLSGFDENAYVEAAGFDERSLRSLLIELETVRAATLRLVETVPDGRWAARGVANGVEVSARALLYITAGHIEHHFNVLRERYGLAVPHVEAPPA